MLPVLAVLPVAVASWSAIFYRWHWAVTLLIVITPFTGPLAYAFYPSPVPLLYRDVLIVIPLYLAFALAGDRSWVPRAASGLPGPLVGLAAAFALLVIVAMANPAVHNPLTALIGAKVWLFYLPLLAVGYALCEGKPELVRLLRLFAVFALVPCLVGLAMWASSVLFGYYLTMTSFYGAAASDATQDFAWFWLGAFMYRIPSTFQFPSQYYGFALFAIVPVYMLLRIEMQAPWRRFARFTLGLIVLSAFLSGARGAYVFVPLLFALIFLVKGRYVSLAKWTAAIAVLMLASLWLSGIEPTRLAAHLFDLMLDYGRNYAWGGLFAAFARGGWLGLGTGMNTGAARRAVPDYIPDHIENWYAKALLELGVPGLVLVVALLGALVYYGTRAFANTSDEDLRNAGAAIVAFLATMLLHALKGWQLDLEPINYYFWLFAGILLRLPSLARPAPSRSAGSGTS
ncbi:MAG: O-antigen ligase family protein [Pseudomonadota bacterium]